MTPYLYTIVEKQKLSEMLESFYHCVNLPIQLLDENGNVLQTFGNTSFCTSFQKYLPQEESCAALHTKASKRAMTLGETYIFSCHANLNHIVFPLVNKSALFGSVLVGPFLMEHPDSVLLSDIAKHYPISTENLLDLYDESQSLTVVLPAKVTQISRLLYYLFSNLISDSRQLIINKEKLYQQSKINESIQKYKSSGESLQTEYPYMKEKELLAKVKSGDAPDAKALLNDLLGYVFFVEGNNLATIKARSIELCSLLSRSAIEGGATTDSILKINNQYLSEIQNIKNIDDLCYQLQEVIDVFTQNMFDKIPTKNSDLIKRAIYYISKNFSYPITLEEVAGHVHLNSAYFSTIFKQSTGSSFKEYLNMVRIEESKRLLSNTQYTIIDIAIATGFEDQSYFSKVFKKYTGMTPKQYRS